MKITKLIKTVDGLKLESKLADFNIRGIACNSKLVNDDFIFVAIKGNSVDGNKYISEAVGRGARVVIYDSSDTKIGLLKGSAIFIKVKDARITLAKLISVFYGNPSKKLKVVGITGTNGKTTISYLIEAIAKEKSAVIGTVNYRFNKKVFTSNNTTPGPVELQSLFSQMLKNKIKYVAMEVSSHALDQNRTEGVSFHSAIFTNLTQDHLDYHKTLGRYFLAKAKLFKNLAGNSFAVINNDDLFGEKLKKLVKTKIITYGIKNKSDVMAKDIIFNVGYTQFTLVLELKETRFNVRLIGKHNIYNVLAAIAWAKKTGFSLNVIKKAIENFSLVPGRLERVPFKGDFSVFVDYAHTEDALKNILESLRNLAKKRIIVVFGCGGDRDKTKRPKMGRVVTELADYAIITSDNPRSEDPLVIINDIKRGITRDNYSVIPERLQAIKKSLSLAKQGDIVLVAGKGHENYQIIKGNKFHFDDREVVRRCLKGN
ncbi:MAG: UDP-N-acetylmuramoyl-L-alanyl-D-glutamate--2,6-diaminopimelate ligase [Candidatus Omnitrophica bacterium]|nr:UDP-N-acetylmuramoyl-L-alanyl-D-glutamate--2,6-diaminopimelate ligase [Candidatus Omnitrophota bacterium]